MEYAVFETKLKYLLSSNNHTNTLLKIIDAPFRYASFLTPLNVLAKVEQSFLRSQENKYYKFIKECAESIINDLGFNFINNTLKVVYNDPETNEEVEETIRAQIVFQKDENDKTIHVVFIKKRDYYSPNQAMEIIQKLSRFHTLLETNLADFTINTYLWFIDHETLKNFDLYEQHNQKYENSKILYGKAFFGLFDNSDQWSIIEQHIKKFKAQNFECITEMPKFEGNKEALEALVNLSSKAWDVLMSTDVNMININRMIFNMDDPNSNFYKAQELRKTKIVDEDEMKNEILKNVLA